MPTGAVKDLTTAPFWVEGLELSLDWIKSGQDQGLDVHHPGILDSVMRKVKQIAQVLYFLSPALKLVQQVKLAV